MRKGKRYWTKGSGLAAIIRAAEPVYHPTLPIKTGHMKELLVYSGASSEEFEVKGPNGEPLRNEDGTVFRTIRTSGNYFDSGEAQREHGWSDEEREAVERRMDHLCDTQPEYFKHLEEAAPTPPWPTYDETHHNQIPTLAAQLGFVEQALAYEAKTKNRGSVIEKLAELHEASTSDAEAEQALSVA